MRAASSTIADILRVNHAGECGAIQIYAGQRWVARWLAPDLVAFLDDALSDEQQHRLKFAKLMRDRRVTPCAVLPLWGVGGWLLGILTGLLGRSAVLACTAGVEKIVHQHLVEQLHWLEGRDPEVFSTIEAIRLEEKAHLDNAESMNPKPAGRVGFLEGLIAGATAALIWISTYGASSRMSRSIRTSP